MAPSQPDPARTVNLHDATITQNHALWPLIVRSGANPEQLIKGVGAAEGLNVLSGGLVPGSTPDANTQRVAGGLYTGTAPSTSTVWSPGDTAGVDADARGKILQDRAKPPEPKMFGDMPYLINPDGSIRPAQGFVPKPDYRDLNGGIVQLGPNGATPVPGAAPQPKLPERQMIGDVLHERQPDGSWLPVKGPSATVSEPGAFAGQSGVEAVALKTVANTSVKLQDENYKPSPQEALDYAASYNHLYEQPKQTFENFPGDPNDPNNPPGMRLVTSYPKPPAGALTPAQVFARVPRFVMPGGAAAAPPLAGPPAAPAPSLAPSGPQTVPAPVQPPAGPAPTPSSTSPADTPDAPLQPIRKGEVNVAPDMDRQVTNLTPDGRVTIQRLTAGGARPASQEQLKDRMYAGRMLLSSAFLDKMNPSDVPDALTAQIVDPLNKNILAGWVKAGMPSDVRRFVIARTGFQTGAMRADSGAAIGATEFSQNDAERSPQPGDGPVDLADKTEHRHQAMRDMAKSAYTGDPEGLKAFYEEAKRRGIDLTEKPTSLPRSATPAVTPPDARPAPKGVDPEDWKYFDKPARDRWLATHGAQ